MAALQSNDKANVGVSVEHMKENWRDYFAEESLGVKENDN